MTIDDQRWDRLLQTRDFLRSLLGVASISYPEPFKRVPMAARREASRLLKHFPEDWWVDARRKEPTK